MVAANSSYAQIQISAKVDLAALDTQIEIFAAAVGEAVPKILHTVARGFITDALKATPPFASLNTLKESFGAQRRTGTAAVERQIKTAFVLPSELSIFKAARQTPFTRRLAELAPHAGVPGLGFEEMLKNANISGQLIKAPTEALHNRLRNNRGRITRGRRQTYIVTDARARDRFIKKKQDLVGRAKAGWLPAADALGVSVPAWIRRQAAEGSVRQGSYDRHSPYIVITNSVSYMRKQDQDLRILQIALRNRLGALERQLAALRAGKFNAINRDTFRFNF